MMLTSTKQNIQRIALMATIDESDYEQACLASHIVCDRTGLRSRNETRSSRSAQDETRQFDTGEEK